MAVLLNAEQIAERIPRLQERWRQDPGSWENADLLRHALARYREKMGTTFGEFPHGCPECGTEPEGEESCPGCPRQKPLAGRVLVCGGRDYRDYGAVRRFLDRIRPGEIVHGAARGADTLAGRYAQDRVLPCREFPPRRDLDGNGRDWKFRRNERMLLASRPDLVVAFPGGPGTAHMVRTARRHGYRVVRAGG